jgi:hypothetical protein
MAIQSKTVSMANLRSQSLVGNRRTLSLEIKQSLIRKPVSIIALEFRNSSELHAFCISVHGKYLVEATALLI